MNRNVLDQTKRISVADTYEGKPISYLQEALRCLGREESDAFLSGIAGEAFVFSYVDAPIDEPQRDHWPDDIFFRAAKPLGFIVSWVTDQPLAEVQRVVKQQVDIGRPLLTHSLDTSRYHGFQLIVGYDYGRGILMLQVADRYDHPGLVETPISEGWAGAIPGPLFWRANPLGLITPDSRTAERDRQRVVRDAFTHAVELWEMKSFPFGRSTVDMQRVGGTGGLDLTTAQAPISAAAYDAVERDLANAHPIQFKMLWRLDAQINRLWYNRNDAGEFLNEVRSLFSSGERRTVDEAAACFNRSTELAKALVEQFWNHGFYGHEPDSAEAYVASIAASRALVTGLPASAPDLVIPDGWRVIDSPWGRAVIVDTPERRRHTLSLIHQLKQSDAGGFRLLQSLIAP